jgi:TonB family protein
MTRASFHCFLVAISTFSSVAFADHPAHTYYAYYAPKPDYPALPSGERPEGSGMFVLHINPKTGVVKSVSIEKSTGFAILDQAAIDAYKRWRFPPGVPTAKCPITFTTHGLPSGWKFER